jgi:hypothetical protein
MSESAIVTRRRARSAIKQQQPQALEPLEQLLAAMVAVGD